MFDVHVRYLDALERAEGLDRALEHLPTSDQLGPAPRRRRADHARVRPPAGLQQIGLFDELLASDLPEDPFLAASSSLLPERRPAGTPT